MKEIVRSVMLAAVMAFMSATSAAQPTLYTDDDLRPATQADLTGVWYQVSSVPMSPRANMSHPWYSEPHYFAFPAPGRMRSLQLTGQQTTLDENVMELWFASPPAWTYEMLPQGGMMLKHVDTPHQFVRLFIFKADFLPSRFPPPMRDSYPAFLPKRGDMQMTYFFEGQPYFTRLLRRYTVPKSP